MELLCEHPEVEVGMELPTAQGHRGRPSLGAEALAGDGTFVCPSEARAARCWPQDTILAARVTVLRDLLNHNVQVGDGTLQVCGIGGGAAGRTCSAWVREHGAAGIWGTHWRQAGW